MPTPNYTEPQNVYDPRWFIWTIVFLVVTGISLVSYIVLSDSGTNDVPDIGNTRIPARPVTSTALQPPSQTR